MGTVTPLHSNSEGGQAPTVGAALPAFTEYLRTIRQRSGYYTATSTIRGYELTLRKLTSDTERVDDLFDTDAGIARLHERFRALWGQAAPATWNAKRAAVKAFGAFARDRGWVHDDTDPAEGLDREPEPKFADRARPRAEVERLVTGRQRHALRDRCLWQMIYSTMARADEILSLNVSDLDMRNRRAWCVRKGGHPEWVMWDQRTARMLAKLVGDRTSGPLFLTERQAKGASKGTVDEADLDPASGRKRLSYDAALRRFRGATGGWTFHDLRHSALTHAAEDGVAVTSLMAKSGHRDIRSLSRYARPSVEHAQKQVERAREQASGT